MNMNSAARDAMIRRAIRRNRLLRRVSVFIRRFMVLLIIAGIGVGTVIAHRSFHNARFRRVTIVENSFLLVEHGRMMPLMQFEPVTPDLPLPRAAELQAAAPENSAIFDSDTAMNRYLAAIYRRAGVSLNRESLSAASRAVTLLDAAHQLDPDAETADLIEALLDLSARFASRQGGPNYLEAWLYLKQATTLLQTSAEPPVASSVIDQKTRQISRQIERNFFYRIKEHLLDGNYRAADILVTELETFGFDHAQVAGFRQQLSRYTGARI